MTITTNPARNEYTATPGQTVFNYTFKIYAAGDLNVYVTPAGQDPDDASDLTVDYVVDPVTVGDEAGGFLTFNAPLSGGEAVTIVSGIDYDRLVDYQNNGDFRPDTVNSDNDRQVSQIKQVLETFGRTISFPVSAQGAQQLTYPTGERNQTFLGFDAEGNPVFIPFGDPSIPVSIIDEQQSLTDGQAVVDFTRIDTRNTGFYISGDGVDQGRLVEGVDFNVTGNSQITLTDTYPAGSIVVGVQNDPTGGVPVTSDFEVVGSVADMKAQAFEIGQTVYTKGYYTAGDGGHAAYIVAATQAVDGYGDHTLANGSVALLQGKENANLLQYGGGASDATGAFNAAVKVVTKLELPFISSGYVVTDTVTIGANDLISQIIGSHVVVKSSFGALAATKKILDSAKAVDLINVNWETDTTDSTGTAPSWDDLTRTFAYKAFNAGPVVQEGSTIRGCRFKNFERGLIVNGTNSLETKTLVENNYFTEIAGGNAGSVKLNQCGNITFQNNAAYLGSECVFTSNTKMNVNNNYLFLPDKPAIDVGGSTNPNVEDIVIYGNVSVGRDGIVCERGSAKTEIYGNIAIPTALTPNGVGIGVTGSVGAQSVAKVHIHGNTIYSYNNEDGTNGNLANGIKVSIDGTGLTCDDISIHDNVMYDVIFGVQVKGFDSAERASNAHVYNNKIMRSASLGITTQFVDTVRTHDNYIVKKGTAYAAGTRGIGFNTVTDAQSKNDECINWGAAFLITDELDEIEIINPILDKGSTVTWTRVIEEGTVNGGHVTIKGLEFDTVPTTGSVRAGSKIDKYTLSEGQSQGWRCIADSAGGGLWAPVETLSGAVAKSATFTVNATNDNGKKFSNFGSVGTIEADLPAGQAGLRYSFRRIANASFRIDPNGSESIRGGGAGKYLQLDANGDLVSLEWDSDSGVWEILDQRGTVSYEP